MTTVDRWLLPDGIEELLPVPAAKVEQLRRTLLDLLASWGYQLVIPPLVEFTESLLIGLGADIDLLTFRVTDQRSGRSMGIRADITPQVARIDAHSLAQPGVSRLCYTGSVLHTKATALLASRSPIKLGAELYGDSSLQADIEVISLMLETLQAAGLGLPTGAPANAATGALTLDLGHVGIYRRLLADCGFSAEREQVVVNALQRKSIPDLEAVLTDVEESLRDNILHLAGLHGAMEVLEKLPDATAELEQLREVAQVVAERYPQVEVYFDLSELRGYHYHTGLVFAAYVSGHGQALANGGRYDDVGEVFGRARPATGFSTDLKALMTLLSEAVSGTTTTAISAPAISAQTRADAALWQQVAALRAAGEVVISRLSDGIDPRCDRQLLCRAGRWQVAALDEDEVK